MQTSQDFQLDKSVEARVLLFEEEIQRFRKEGALDPIATKKLQEFFRVEHIYHSTGIEGNRLSLRETEMVLLEGVHLNDKPLADQEEVKDLDAALSFLFELSTASSAIRETDIRELHRLAVLNLQEADPGAYRKIGVVITGSEHRPPEPVAVPGMMQKLVEWLNATNYKSPLAAAAYAHHQIAAIHPFVDGNGRVARLLMNLILLRSGYPIVNIRREDRTRYYEALSFADAGIYDLLVELILDRANYVFSEMKRVKDETERLRIYAQRWGQTEAAVIQRREEREHRIWLGRMEVIQLEFETVADLLDERLTEIKIDFWKYPSPDLSKFTELRERGRAPQNWFFRIRVKQGTSGAEENFVFNFYRNPELFSRSKVIPLVLNRINEEGVYAYVTSPGIRLREIYYEGNQLTVRMVPADNPSTIMTSTEITAAQVAREFFDDVLKECCGLVI